MALTLGGCGSKGKEAADKTITKDNYPEKAIKLIVPVGAGGVHDVYARLLAKGAEKELKQPVVVENKAGGGNVVGTTEGLTAPPDGYTLTWLMTGAIAIQPLVQSVPYNLDQITFVLRAVSEPHALIVPENTPPKNVQQFFEWARSKGELKTGSNGVATTPHFGAVRLAKIGNVKFNVVPGYSQMGEVANAVANGQLDFGIIPVGLVEGVVKQGKVRIIALLAEERSLKYPEVSTAKEQGYDISVTSWGGIVVPKNTPEERVKKLHDAFKKALDSQEVRDSIKNIGGQITYLDGDSWRKKIVEERNVNEKLIAELRAQGILK